jgi:predicted RNA binding protein YcfA (HicA-like mRNA interferase family)
MKIPRDLSGRDLVEALRRSWGYVEIHQVGSHIILQTLVPSAHRIAIPDHSPLRIGTLNSILRAVAAHKQTTREAILRSIR